MAQERDEHGFVKGSAASELLKRKKPLGQRVVKSCIIWAIVWVVCFFLLPMLNVPSVPDWVKAVILGGLCITPFLIN